MRALLLLWAVVVTLVHSSEGRYPHVVTVDQMKSRKPRMALTNNRNHHPLVHSVPRGGAFSVLGWTVPANQLAKIYVGFTGVNGVAMAVLPTIAANLYGSAFDDSKESLLATLLLERQGDAVLGTSILLYLSTFTEMPLANSITWSVVPYVMSLVKFIATGQVTTLGFDNRVAIAMLVSIVLPSLTIVVGGWNPTIAANVLATALLFYGAFGSVSPGQSASLEGLDLSSSPGEWLYLLQCSSCHSMFTMSFMYHLYYYLTLGWIGACWSLASLCILQHAILMWRVLLFNSDADLNIQSTVGFAALLNVVISAYVAFASGIPEAVEIPKIGFVVWMVIGLVVGFGILGG